VNKIRTLYNIELFMLMTDILGMLFF